MFSEQSIAKTMAHGSCWSTLNCFMNTLLYTFCVRPYSTQDVVKHFKRNNDVCYDLNTRWYAISARKWGLCLTSRWTSIRWHPASPYRGTAYMKHGDVMACNRFIHYLSFVRESPPPLTSASPTYVEILRSFDIFFQLAVDLGRQPRWLISFYKLLH